MIRTFLTSDTHFGHENIIKYCDRPFKDANEMDEALVRNWNSVVSPGDRVFHLGDVTLARDDLSVIGRLNGDKILIRGNHDRANIGEYLIYFKDVLATHTYRGFLLSHIPVHESQQHRFRGNIHGHIHEKNLPDPWYANISVEQTNYTPVTLEQIIKKHYKDKPKTNRKDR